jgi:heat shock protein HtpX
MTMIVLPLGVLVNWWLAAAFIHITLCIINSTTPMSKLIPTAYGSSAVIIAVLIGIGYTPYTDIVFRIIGGCRRPIRSEEMQFGPIFDQVCQRAGIAAGQFELRVCEDKFPNAFALGNSTVAVSRGLLIGGSDDEIRGVLAHELGHIHNGDSVRTKIFCIVSMVGQLILMMYLFIAKLLAWIGRLPIPLANILASIVSLIIRIQVTLIEWLIMLPLTIGQYIGSRQQEYRADQYAASLGYGSELKNFLYKILDLDEHPSGLLGIVWRIHPKIGDRIRKLEQDNTATEQSV